MKSLIVNTNPQNNWLSSNITAYLKSGEYNYNTGPIEAQNLPQDVISNFSQVVQYFLELGAGEWSVTQVIAEQGSQYSSGHYETSIITGENPLYDENLNITGVEITTHERENYVLDAIKPTLNLSISDKLNKNNLMQRTLIYNTKDFPLNIENNMFSIWNHFKENY
jgi:hypothetical protein